jgi:hypothetical protein
VLTAKCWQVMDVIKRLRPLLFEPKHSVIQSGTLGLLKPHSLVLGSSLGLYLTFRDEK